MEVYLGNEFNLGMLNRILQAVDMRAPRPIDLASAKSLIHEFGFTSVVDNVAMAAVFQDVLGTLVPVNHGIDVSLGDDTDDAMVVGLYTGPKLADDAKALPEGSRIDWWVI